MQPVPYMVPNPDITCESISEQKHFSLCANEFILKRTDYATYHIGLRGVSCDLYLTNHRIVACGNMGSWMKLAAASTLYVMSADKPPKISCQVLLSDIDHIETKRQLLVKKLVPITKSGKESFGFITLKMDDWKNAFRDMEINVVDA